MRPENSLSSAITVSDRVQKEKNLKREKLFILPSYRFAGFRATHVTNSEKWVLHIDYVQAEDEGNYLCQISSEPKMSLPFNLKVIGKCT